MNNEERNLLKSYYILYQKYCKQARELERLRSIIKESIDYIKENAIYDKESKAFIDNLDFDYLPILLKILDEKGLNR